MKTFQNTAAQGELYITRIDKLPEGVIRVDPVDGLLIVGHSETGHHHVMEAEHTEMYRLPEEIYDLFLKVDKDTMLTHLRTYDTHEAILHTPGFYRVRTQTEETPQGWRQSLD